MSSGVMSSSKSRSSKGGVLGARAAVGAGAGAARAFNLGDADQALL